MLFVFCRANLYFRLLHIICQTVEASWKYHAQVVFYYQASSGNPISRY
jgi:hypothetical protein